MTIQTFLRGVGRLSCILLFGCVAVGGESRGDPRAAPYIDGLHVPSGLRPAVSTRPVTIAIVDDGFRLTHSATRAFFWPNPREKAGNGVDDDGNGRIDDIFGWDVADDDEDVTAPNDAAMFYHGTHLAGIVAEIVRHAYGPDAARFVRILPVKALSDTADRPYLKDGYKGIQYAVDAGADIILTAWSEAELASAKQGVLQSAQERGIVVVASAGNFPEEKAKFPAAYPPVVAVSSVELNGVKWKSANYGGFVDLLAPGSDVESAGISSDAERVRHTGTSMASAMVAASVAILKLQRPELSREEVLACLKNTADPVERLQEGEINYAGKLGAGRVNLQAALEYPLRREPLQPASERRQHQGYLASFQHPAPKASWQIQPDGVVRGFWFEPKLPANATANGRFSFYPVGSVATGKPVLQLELKDWKQRRFVAGRQVTVVFEPLDSGLTSDFLIEYASEGIDFSTVYCRDTRQVRTEGIIEDGSGPANYSPRSDCKWLITAPAGKVIHIRFLELDTEPKVDWIYFFNGAGTHEKMMAGFSGVEIPPELTTWSNQALLWFVTNESIQGRGWKADVRFVDPPVAPVAP